MANEISSMTLANMPSASSATNSSQLVKSEPASADTGKALPTDGKASPQPANNSAEISEAVGQINDFIQTVDRNLSFSMDDTSGKTVIKVIDSNSGQLIRQIPNEEVLALASHLQELSKESVSLSEMSSGILFSEKT